MNAENTRQTEEAKRKADENIMNIHNMDMSQEAPMMPVYIPIIDEHHHVYCSQTAQNKLMIDVLVMYCQISKIMMTYWCTKSMILKHLLIKSKWLAAIHQWLKQSILI